MNKFLAALRGFFTRLKHVFTKVEAAVKTAAASVIGGGILAVGDAVRAGHFVVDLQHILALKAAFISGAVVSFVMYLSKFPAFHQGAQQGESWTPGQGPGGRE